MIRASNLFILTVCFDVLLGGCTNVSYPGVSFICGQGGSCPTGYSCHSDYCIRDGLAVPATKIETSAERILPVLLPDPDRGGVVSCWTVNEDQQSGTGGVYAAFASTDGTVHSRTRLVEFDATNRAFAGSCAPVPGTQGKLLVTAWSVSETRADQRMWIWTPDDANGFTGTSRSYYDEPFASPSALSIDRVQPAVVGNEAWVAINYQTGAGDSESWPPNELLRYRVSAADLVTGFPRRDVLSDELATNSMSAQLTASGDGAWITVGFLRQTTLISGAPGSIQLSAPLPTAGLEFGFVLAANGNEAAITWPECPSLEVTLVGPTTRVGWITPATLDHVTYGPRLPFSRTDTPSPGGMRIGTNLYVFGAPSGTPIPALAIPSASNRICHGATGMQSLPDAGVDAGTDGGVDAAAVQNVPPVVTSAPLVMYRVAWDATDAAEFQPVMTIPRPLGERPVPIAAAQLLPDGQHFALSWVEFTAPNAIGHGALYAMYLQVFPVPQ